MSLVQEYIAVLTEKPPAAKSPASKSTTVEDRFQSFFDAKKEP
jgi:hypothetical protein